MYRICEENKFTAKMTGGGDGGYCACFIPKTEDQNKVETFLAV